MSLSRGRERGHRPRWCLRVVAAARGSRRRARWPEVGWRHRPRGGWRMGIDVGRGGWRTGAGVGYVGWAPTSGGLLAGGRVPVVGAVVGGAYVGVGPLTRRKEVASRGGGVPRRPDRRRQWVPQATRQWRQVPQVARQIWTRGERLSMMWMCRASCTYRVKSLTSVGPITDRQI
jgi:hypothetical protein